MFRSITCSKLLQSSRSVSEVSLCVLEKLRCQAVNSSPSFLQCFLPNAARHFHSSLPRSKAKDDKRSLIASGPIKDDGTSGESAINIDALIQSRRDMFPTEETPNMIFKGVPFKEVPIVNIRVSQNNSIFSLSEGKTGEVKVYRTCGIEGFRNTRKGTNIAAQATAISFSSLVLARGVNTVRVRVQGLGPGRMSSIKGLQMAGLDIISVTDSTRVSDNPPRPRKRRRL